MRTKAIVWMKDGTNGYHVPRKVVDNHFRYRDCEYFVTDESQITEYRGWRSLWLWTIYYNTLYYFQGSPKPLPIRQIRRSLDEGAAAPGFVDLGVSGEELAAVFEPYFYREIGGAKDGLMITISFWVLVATACGVGWLILRSMGQL